MSVFACAWPCCAGLFPTLHNSAQPRSATLRAKFQGWGVRVWKWSGARVREMCRARRRNEMCIDGRRAATGGGCLPSALFARPSAAARAPTPLRRGVAPGRRRTCVDLAGGRHRRVSTMSWFAGGAVNDPGNKQHWRTRFFFVAVCRVPRRRCPCPECARR